MTQNRTRSRIAILALAVVTALVFAGGSGGESAGVGQPGPLDVTGELNGAPVGSTREAV
jgi:hypothetical protein